MDVQKTKDKQNNFEKEEKLENLYYVIAILIVEL